MTRDEALKTALRQWHGYAQDFDSRDLRDDESPEGDLYRTCKAALNAEPAPDVERVDLLNSKDEKIADKIAQLIERETGNGYDWLLFKDAGADAIRAARKAIADVEAEYGDEPKQEPAGEVEAVKGLTELAAFLEYCTGEDLDFHRPAMVATVNEARAALQGGWDGLPNTGGWEGIPEPYQKLLILTRAACKGGHTAELEQLLDALPLPPEAQP